jgi:superfamily II DNA/RNA helicase
MTLPVALSGHDVIGQAKTGTGKTLGFALPILDRVVVAADVEAGRATAEQLSDTPQALVVVPTRELCVQVTNDLLTAGKVRNVRVLPVYGGRAYEPQLQALAAGVDVVVGTPGRLLDLAGQKKLRLGRVRALVLDEADEMLDLGFLPDVEKIIDLLPAKRQTMLFSATMPGQVINLARRYMDHPTHIRATAPDDTGHTVTSVSQHVFRAHSLDKVETVARILQAEGRGLAMIFCRTKRTAADVAEQLRDRGFAAGAVHGDLAQGAREQALRAFRNGKVDVLVCTDVAARGIDVEGVTHVVNYQCPEDEKTYLHRIGRTGRAGASGTAVTLVDWDDVPRWQLINKALELDFNDPLETYSTSPHLYELLRIPAGTKGVLPRAERTRAGLDAEEIEDLGETGARGRGRGRGPAGRGAEEAESRPGRQRRRRRTRGGADAAGAPQPADAPAAPSSGSDPDAPRRRRRRTRRGAAEAAEVVATAGPASDAAEAVDAVAAVEAPATELAEAGASTRRHTRRRAAEAAEAVTAVETPATELAEALPEAAAPVVEAPKRRRTRRAAGDAAEAAVVEAVDAAAEAVAADTDATPRRRTRRSAVEAAEAVATAEAPAAELAEATAPVRRRTRRSAAAPEAAVEAVETVAEAAAEVAEVAPRRRTRRVSEAVEAAPEEAAPKRRRTRQVTEAPEAVAPEEAPAPRRRKKAAAPAEADGTPEAATEAPAARRTRARRTAEPAVDVTPEAEEVPAPRRRTRRTADAAVVEPATAPDVDAPAVAAPRRRTRTAAAADGNAEAPAAKRTRARRTAAAEGDDDAPEAGAPAAKRTRTRAAAKAEVPAPRSAERATAEH